MYIKQFKEISDKAFWKKVDKSKELFRLARKYKLSEYLIEEVAEHIKVTAKKMGYYNWDMNLKIWWRNVAWYQTMTEDFILKHINLMDWDCISCNQSLTEDFIEKHKDRLHWKYLSTYVPLSENLIDKYSDKVDWKDILEPQELSEPFILKHQDKISWTFLMKNCHLDKEFFERNKHLIEVKLCASDLVKIIERQKLSEETLSEIKKGKMAWRAISESATLTRGFVISNYEKIDARKVIFNRRTDKLVREEVEMIERLSGN